MNSTKNNVPFSIQKMIKNYLKEQHITPTQLARRLSMRPISAHQMLERPTMQVDRLWSICLALDVNIFQAVANELDIEHYHPKVDQLKKEIETGNQQINALKKELELLTHENNTLKEVIGLLRK
ncbi:hypothetical protein [Labilibaculum manganireducens]|uniref:hypothetical protein n=1 Tax=Labilibaculum manganireducens TaxID=1940525 RepID=UPI0029F57293|nr:hypothetical protein [Labilibaculum manganireducens]